MLRKKRRKNSHIDESWLLPYSDLLTLLLALFIVLFAMSEVDTKKYKELSQVFEEEFSGGNGIFEHDQSPVEMPESSKNPVQKKAVEEETSEAKEKNDLAKLQNEINNYIESNDLQDQLGTNLTENGLMITILNDISFDSGSAEVNERGKRIAREISGFLAIDPPHEIVISGHTDDVPIQTSDFGSNWDLSVMRAVHFMRLVLENDDLDPSKFSAKGFGMHKPVVPNDSDKNRAQNRRVEVLILP